jgi:hypothetical protein
MLETPYSQLIKFLIGAFNPGSQPRGTPIIAEVSTIGYPAIQIMWKNVNGRFVSSCCDEYSRWNTPTTEYTASKDSQISEQF